MDSTVDLDAPLEDGPATDRLLLFQLEDYLDDVEEEAEEEEEEETEGDLEEPQSAATATRPEDSPESGTETQADAPRGARKRLPSFETAAEEAPRDPEALTQASASEQSLPVGFEETFLAVRRATRRLARSSALTNLRGPARIGSYELRGILGEGGCGAVFGAWDLRHEREVALKWLFRSDERGLRRFEREVRAIARLRHANIVPLLDSGVHEGRPYLVMERIRGRSLSDASQSELSLRDRVRLVRDAAKAIHYAHEQGILHRDLKPQNVLVDQHGEACIVDFGLARSEGDAVLTRAGAPLGTPAYMPPEQAGASEHPIDRRSDVYSLGATLYHALCGRPPFLGPSDRVLGAVLRSKPERPSARAPDTPRDLDDVVLRCLEKDPGLRYPTAQALAEDLERWLRGEPVEARPASVWSRARRWILRERATAALLGLLLLAICLILFLAAQNLRLASQLGS